MKQGWKNAQLKDACLVFTDGDWIESKDQSDKGIRLVQTGNIGFGFFKDKKDKARFISEETFNRLKCTEILPGDLLVSRLPDPVGKSCIIPELNSKMITGVDCTIIRPNRNLNSEFLSYYQMSHQYLSDVQAGVSGATRQRISRKNLGLISIPLPPLPEQQRIVSILDEAFAAIDKAKANAEQNLQNAKELFESYLQGVFENGDWELVKLSEMATDITDGDHMPPPKSELGLPFITISNINKQTHKIDFSDTFKVPQKYYDNLKPNRKPIKRDVLYTVTGSYGIPVLIEDDFQFCFQRHIGLIRPSNKLDSKLLYYWILSPQAFLQANETATGTAQKTVSLKSLRNFSFPNIPLKEQKTIVHQLDTLQVETQKLEAVYQKKMEDLEELKKSILQKAFAGELETEKSLLV